MQFLAGRAAATGIAAANTIAMLSGFAAPYYMGIRRDATGSYQAGLRELIVPCLCGVVLMMVLTRSLKRKDARLLSLCLPGLKIETRGTQISGYQCKMGRRLE